MKAPAGAIELARIQQWMQAVIIHPEGVEAGIASPDARSLIDIEPDRIEDVVCRSESQTSIERLLVYANAYSARLLEVLEAEFPALVYALGRDLFGEFAFAYLQECPSRSYTLGDLSADFPEYLKRTRPPRERRDENPDWADFLADLALLERTFSEVFDGPGVEQQALFSPEELRHIDPQAWLQMRLIPVPCLRLLTVRFPVHDYAKAVRLEQNPELPAAALTHLIITRREYVVRRTAVGAAEFAALSVLVQGGTIEESLEAAESEWSGPFEQLIEDVQRWFHDWAAAGYFLRIARPEEVSTPA